MRSFFLLCILNGVESSIKSEILLTPKENSERIKECGRFPLNGSSANSSLWDVSWLYQLEIGLYFSKVAAISKKHVMASSDIVLHYSVGYPGWIHNDSVFDRESYCKKGIKYLELPTDVIKNFSSINRFPVLRGYILNICDQNAWDYPMILVLSEAFQSFVCIADESTSISLKTDVYAYGYNETDRSMYPFRLNILNINESSIDLNMIKRGYYSGPIVAEFGNRITQIGIIPNMFYGDIRFSAEPIRKIEESLCTLFGICNKESTEATTIGGPFTRISTANVAHSASTDDATDQENSTTSSVTPGGQDYNSSSHTDDVIDRENSTTSSVTPGGLDFTSVSHTDDVIDRENSTTSSDPPGGLDFTSVSHTDNAIDRENSTTSSDTLGGLDFTSVSHTDDAIGRENSTTSSGTPEINYTSASHTDDVIDRENTTTSSVTLVLDYDHDWDRNRAGRDFVVTQAADYTDEIDVAYDEFMEEYEKMMKENQKSSGKKLLNIELCALILVVICVIY